MKSGFTAALLACAFLGGATAADVVVKSPPAAAPKEASLWAARVVERYRYNPDGQPDGRGARPFDRFVDALDPERMVFTELDLVSMAGQRTVLDRLTDEKQMEIPDAVFATYLVRLIALHAHALDVLHRPLEFNGHERFQRVRSKAAREPDDATLRDLWRRRVMDDYLNLRLAGVPEARIIPTLEERYDHKLRRAQAMRSEDVASLFLNAYVQYFDPHGAYLEPVTGRLGDMVGIGMVLQKVDDLVTVREVVVGSPADRDGNIGPGDRVVGVAQGSGQPMTDVIGWRVDDVVALIRGVAGSPVVLDILPQGAALGGMPRRVLLSRAKIQLEDQRARGYIEQIRHGASAYRIGVIVVPTFYQDYVARRAGAKDYISATHDVAAALEQMKIQKADAILLDMRNNGGGALGEAIELAGLFLSGVPVVQQVTTEPKVTVETRPQGRPVWDGPMAVLIGRGSAAATEIMAAAVQDYGRGLVIGDISYGRGSVQTLIDLNLFSKDPAKRFGDVKLTVAVLCRASGKPIQRVGVTPDIMVPGRIDATGEANTDLFADPACKTREIPKSANLDRSLPILAEMHASRMQANRSYQAQLTQRTQQEARLSSDEVSLNETERRITLPAKPAGDIEQLQLAEALWILSDAVDQMRLEPAAGKP